MKTTLRLSLGLVLLAVSGLAQTTNPPGSIGLTNSTTTTNAPGVATVPGTGSNTNVPPSIPWNAPPSSGYTYPILNSQGVVVWPTNFAQANGLTGGGTNGGGIGNVDTNVFGTNGGSLSIRALPAVDASQIRLSITYSNQPGIQPARIPWRGWDSWMLYGLTVAQTNVTAIVDGFITYGLRDAGWSMVCVDDGWSAWDANGRVTNNSKFPNGIKWLADYCHTNGVKLGLYMFPYLTNTPGAYPASGTNFADDVLRMATNGVDFIFWESYSDASDAIAMQGVYALQRNFPKVITQSSRQWPRAYDPVLLNAFFPTFTFGDPSMDNTNLVRKVQALAPYFAWIGPGHYISLGSTPVGTDPPYGEFDLTYQSLQATLAAPIYKLYAQEQHWYGQRESTNKSFASIHQDPLVASPVLLTVTNNLGNTNSIGVARRMVDGSYALWHFSMGPGWVTNSIYLPQLLGLPAICSVRSVWDDCFIGYATNYLTEAATNGQARFRRVYPGLVTDIKAGTNYLDEMWWNKDFSSNGCFVPSSIWVELPQRQTDAAGRSIVVGGATYPRGITVRANGCLNYFVGGQADAFHAVIGPQIDAGSDQTNYVRLVGDGVTLWQSQAITAGTSTNIMISLAGVNKFQIITTNNFNVNWAVQLADSMFIKATPGNIPLTLTADTVSARTFVGDGSGLTGLSASATNSVATLNGKMTNPVIYNASFVGGDGSGLSNLTYSTIVSNAPFSLQPEKVPWIGINTWNAIGGTNVSEGDVTALIDSMVTNGMVAAGAKYVVLDDGWTVWDANSRITNNYRFPSGIAYLANYAHTNGLKFGLYLAPGTTTPGNLPGSGTNLPADALKYAQQGVDYFKIETYTAAHDLLVRQATFVLQQTNSPAVIEASCTVPQPWMPSTVNAFWPVFSLGDPTFSITDFTNRVRRVIPYLPIVGPGHFLSMALDGPGSGAEYNKYALAYRGFQAAIASPIYANYASPYIEKNWYTGCEFTNSDLIAMVRDPLVMPARQPWTTNASDVLTVARLLSDGSYAVWNYSPRPGNIGFGIRFSDLGLPSVCAVRDVYAQAWLGTWTNWVTGILTNGQARLWRVKPGVNTDIQPGTNYLDSLWWIKDGSSNSWGTSDPGNMWSAIPPKRVTYDGNPITLNGTTYARGIVQRAQSAIGYYLGGQANTFHAVAGIDPNHAGSYAVAKIIGDGVILWQSGQISADNQATNITINVSGVKYLTLMATNAIDVGYTICWGDAMFIGPLGLITTNTPAAGQVLTSDGHGTQYWSTPAATSGITNNQTGLSLGGTWTGTVSAPATNNSLSLYDTNGALYFQSNPTNDQTFIADLYGFSYGLTNYGNFSMWLGGYNYTLTPTANYLLIGSGGNASSLQLSNLYAYGFVTIEGALNAGGSAGSAGQVLTSTGSGIGWSNAPSGVGGSATNAIGNNGGVGTNTTLYGSTSISNLVSGVTNAVGGPITNGLAAVTSLTSGTNAVLAALTTGTNAAVGFAAGITNGPMTVNGAITGASITASGGTSNYLSGGTRIDNLYSAVTNAQGGPITNGLAAVGALTTGTNAVVAALTTGTNAVVAYALNATNDVNTALQTKLNNGTNAAVGFATAAVAKVLTNNPAAGSFTNYNGFYGNPIGLTNIQPSALAIVTNAAPLTNTIVGFFWLTNGANVYKIPLLQ